MNKPMLILFLALLLGLFFSCEETTRPTNTGDDPIDFDECDRNALLMDLYLSNAARPSFDYYYDIVDHIETIKEDYGEVYPDILRQRFRFPYVDNELILVSDDTTKALIDIGEYDAWDSLNIAYDLDTILVYSHYSLLQFNCCTDMTFIDDYYLNLPGITTASRNWYNWPYSNLYPRVSGDTTSYLYADCKGSTIEGGCGAYEYLYIRFVENKFEFIGYWDTDIEKIPPDWWFEEAMYNDLQYYEWYRYGIWPDNDT